MTDSCPQLTNEFKFSIAAFHHAHEAYLAPDLLRKMYGSPPAVALFAAFARYKAGSLSRVRVCTSHSCGPWYPSCDEGLLILSSNSSCLLNRVPHSPITQVWTLDISSTKHSKHTSTDCQRISPLPLSLPRPQKLLALDTALAM